MHLTAQFSKNLFLEQVYLWSVHANLFRAMFTRAKPIFVQINFAAFVKEFVWNAALIGSI